MGGHAVVHTHDDSSTWLEDRCEWASLGANLYSE